MRACVLSGVARRTVSGKAEPSSKTPADNRRFRLTRTACIANAVYRPREPGPASGNTLLKGDTRRHDRGKRGQRPLRRPRRMESPRNTTEQLPRTMMRVWIFGRRRTVASLRTGEAAYRGSPRMLRPTGWTAICRALSQQPAESPCPHQGPRRRTRNPCAMATLATAQYRAVAVPRRSRPELELSINLDDYSRDCADSRASVYRIN